MTRRNQHTIMRHGVVGDSAFSFDHVRPLNEMKVYVLFFTPSETTLLVVPRQKRRVWMRVVNTSDAKKSSHDDFTI